jgi:hypothetical protein
MLINCETCLARDIACDDCVVNLIFHEGLLDLAEDEAEAIANLSEAGLIPQLRLVPPGSDRATVEGWRDSATG